MSYLSQTVKTQFKFVVLESNDWGLTIFQIFRVSWLFAGGGRITHNITRIMVDLLLNVTAGIFNPYVNMVNDTRSMNCNCTVYAYSCHTIHVTL